MKEMDKPSETSVPTKNKGHAKNIAMQRPGKRQKPKTDIPVGPRSSKGSRLSK